MLRRVVTPLSIHLIDRGLHHISTPFILRPIPLRRRPQISSQCILLQARHISDYKYATKVSRSFRDGGKTCYLPDNIFPSTKLLGFSTDETFSLWNMTVNRLGNDDGVKECHIWLQNYSKK